MYIGLLEDEPQLAHYVCEILESAGHTVSIFNNGADIVKAVGRDTIDLFVLDWRVPRMSGLEVLQHIRNVRGLTEPVLFLTSRTDEQDIAEALNAGADDYLPKPFEPRELLARIRAVLRRHAPGEAAETSHQTLKFGSLELDRDARTVSVRGQVCDLTAYQFDLLWVLAERAGRVLSRDQIMEAVRGKELEAFDRSIDVHMGRIRAAIEDDAKAPKRILTVRGVGYVFAKQQD